MSAWKTYLWLTFIGLMASAVNWSKIVHDENGRLRWGAIAFQIPLEPVDLMQIFEKSCNHG